MWGAAANGHVLLRMIGHIEVSSDIFLYVAKVFSESVA